MTLFGFADSIWLYLAGFAGQIAAVWDMALAAKLRIKLGREDLRVEDLSSLVLQKRG